jgi:hypothetical protein
VSAYRGRVVAPSAGMLSQDDIRGGHQPHRGQQFGIGQRCASGAEHRYEAIEHRGHVVDGEPDLPRQNATWARHLCVERNLVVGSGANEAHHDADLIYTACHHHRVRATPIHRDVLDPSTG